MIKMIKKILLTFVAIAVIIGMSMVFSYYHVLSTSNDYMYNEHSNIPTNNVGVVLGTSKYGRLGGVNPYFKHRMDAAYELYKHKKIKHILVSGDNHVDGYNEPQQMKDYLVSLGVKENHITMDYAGLRTFDSMIRAEKVFGQHSFTIISQQFHNERAVFIARTNGIEAIGYNAKSPVLSKRMKLREFLAKYKAVLDIYLLKTTPKFLGEKIEIEL